MLTMEEYKVSSYTEQKLCNRTLLPKGKKETKYCVYKKKFPFPNKSIFLWEPVADNFKTEKEAKAYIDSLDSLADEQ